MLVANGIPLGVFTAPAVLEVLTATAGRVIDEHDARDGLGCLHRLSLITLNLDSPSRAVRANALVQRAIHDSLPDERTAAVVRAAPTPWLRVWPDIERATVLAQVPARQHRRTQHGRQTALRGNRIATQCCSVRATVSVRVARPGTPHIGRAGSRCGRTP